MIKLIDFIENKLEINWKLINIGCLGSKFFFKELTYKDITDYAISILTDKNNDIILKILSFDEDEYQEMGEFIKELAFKEKSNYKIAYEKWKLVYVIKNMPSKNINCIQGIIKLYDIWSKLDFPKESPLIVQGLNNEITPENYYTESNYIFLYNKHISWIEEKMKFLNGK